MSSVAAIRGFVTGPYPERVQPVPSKLDQWSARWLGRARARWSQRLSRSHRVVELGRAHAARMAELNGPAAEAQTRSLRARLAAEGFADEVVAEAFAWVAELTHRTLGMRPYDVQWLGGHILLEGRVAEMQTGEGKTLTATLPAATAALAGLPVHVISVNDYLVARDAEEMRPLYEALGLSVGVIQQDQPPEVRREQYACDVTYVSNNEVAFDYLKDRIALGRERKRTQLSLARLAGAQGRADRLLLRGLVFGIVDEADSVLVDEARTPLVISAGDSTSELADEFYETAVEIALTLEAGTHYILREFDRSVSLTDDGKLAVDGLTAELGSLWRGPNRREQFVRQALCALHSFVRDRDYLVEDGKIVIIDESTGRRMPDRSWEQGLHQMVEAKEGCDITGQNAPLAKISYQRFFRRYRHLAGMTGTAAEVAGELWSVYRLGVTTVPTHRPVQREDLGESIFEGSDERWAAVVARIAGLNAIGRPVLVGTRTVEASELLSQRLAEQGIVHRVLNARQDAEEAAIIEEAGHIGRVTVATNMAGRGTDIKPDPDALALGGLHVICTERNDAGRIDRQLFGRAGRQGNPGSYEVFASLDDELARRFLGILRRVPVGATASARGALLRRAQRIAERVHAAERRQVLDQDEHTERSLAFAGGGE